MFDICFDKKKRKKKTGNSILLRAWQDIHFGESEREGFICKSLINMLRIFRSQFLLRHENFNRDSDPKSSSYSFAFTFYIHDPKRKS